MSKTETQTVFKAHVNGSQVDGNVLLKLVLTFPRKRFTVELTERLKVILAVVYKTRTVCNINDVLLNNTVLPIFTKRPTDRTVKEGEEATFYCTATGNPTPKLTWLKDGKSVGAGETLKVVAHKNNSGNYWCSADNGLGLAINASAYLNVQCKYELQFIFSNVI